MIFVVGGDLASATADAVSKAVAAALWQCTQWHITTLACPALGAPALTTAESAAVILPIIREHMRNADHPTTVLVILSDPQDQETFTARLGQG